MLNFSITFERLEWNIWSYTFLKSSQEDLCNGAISKRFEKLGFLPWSSYYYQLFNLFLTNLFKNLTYQTEREESIWKHFVPTLLYCICCYADVWIRLPCYVLWKLMSQPGCKEVHCWISKMFDYALKHALMQFSFWRIPGISRVPVCLDIQFAWWNSAVIISTGKSPIWRHPEIRGSLPTGFARPWHIWDAPWLGNLRSQCIDEGSQSGDKVCLTKKEHDQYMDTPTY